MKWLEETHGSTFELVRHFLACMFDSELFSTRGQWGKVALSAFALALLAGMVLLDPGYATKYRRLSALPTPEPFRAAAVADELALVTLVAAITGLLGVLAWQSLFPGRRDYLALAALPVRPRQIFAARFASVLFFSIALAVVLNILPSIIAPLRFAGRWQKNASYFANAAAHGVSSGLACLFVLLAIVALQGVLLNALPGRLFTRVSSYAQGVLTAVLFLAGLFSWSIADWGRDTIGRLPEFGAWAPPVWFVGLHERILGDRDPFMTAMASRALLAVAAAAVMAILTYLVSYRRYRRLLLEAAFEAVTPPARRWSLARLLGGDPRREAILEFMARTLARSRLHRLVLLAYIGAAAGIMLNSALLAGAATKWATGWRGSLQFVSLFWPLVATVIVLAGFRHAFSMPAELPANWIFRIAESQGRALWMSAVERFVIAYAVIPIYLLLSPVAVAVLGWELAARMTALELLVSLSMFELRFRDWQQLPFTCSYVPGKRSLMAVLMGWLAALGIVVPVLTIIIATASRMTEPFLICLGVFGAFWIWARRFRRDGWGESRMIYEDVPEAMPDLGIKELTYGGHGPDRLKPVPHA